ncbi:MAG: signal recognition particle-docking protein FtsY [Verrucomicrobiota bacterium]
MIGQFKKWIAQAQGGKIDWDELEAALIQADLGLDLVDSVIDRLQNQPLSAETIQSATREELLSLWPTPVRELKPGTPEAPAVWLIVGVNGTGKTTTIAKLAHRFHHPDHPVHMVAADTFRAAAIEQLRTWSERLGTGFSAGTEGGDPAAAAFQGIESGLANQAATLLVDTAGRLHNKEGLMRELEKVKRVIGKHTGQPQETLLVIDGASGKNAIEQAKQFHEILQVTGVIATKLEGSSKGGAIATLKQEFDLDTLYLGTGETPADLNPFAPDHYISEFFAE